MELNNAFDLRSTRLILYTLILGLATKGIATEVTKVDPNEGCHAYVETRNNGRHYIDLTKLEQNRFIWTEENGSLKERYTLGICGHRVDATFPTNKTTCLNNTFLYGKVNEAGAHSCHGLGNESTLILSNSQVALKTYFTNGSGHADASHYHQIIQLSCSTEGTMFECKGTDDEMPCSSWTGGNHFTLKSKLFCFDDEPITAITSSQPPVEAPENPNTKKGPFKLSPGSIILMVSGSVFITYLLLGVVYGVGKGEKGLNRLPNSDFWLELPLLVKDGARFTFGICTRPGGGYVPIEDKSATGTAPITDV